MKRVLLFVGTNIAIIAVLSIVLSIVGPALGIDRNGYGGLLLFSAVFGFGGAFISLLLSKTIAKHSVGAQIITRPSNQTERWLVDTIARQARAAGVNMPKWRFTTRLK